MKVIRCDDDCGCCDLDTGDWPVTGTRYEGKTK